MIISLNIMDLINSSKEITDPENQMIKFIHDYKSDGEYSPKCKRCRQCDHYEDDINKFFCVEYSSDCYKVSCYKCLKEGETNVELLCVSGFGIDHIFDKNGDFPICSRCNQNLVINKNNILSIRCSYVDFGSYETED